MRKAAPAKESGLEVMQAKFSRKARSIARVELVSTRPRMYRLTRHIADNGRENPNIKLAHKRPHLVVGAFFASADMLYGGCAWAGFGLAGCQLARFLTPRTVRHHLPRENGGDGSETQVGASPMKHDPARNPSALQDRAAAHRAMALAALRADSSLSTRLKRHNHHVSVARTLEAEQQQTTPTRDPRTALAWLKSGGSLRIDSLNLRDHLRHVRALAALEAKGGAQ